MLDALLRLDLRVDPRSRRRRRCSCLVLGACVRWAVCGLTSHRAAFTKRLRFSPRRRSRATVCIETRACRAFRLVAVEARSRASFVGHGCAWLWSKNWCHSESDSRGVAWSEEPPVVCSLAPAASSISRRRTGESRLAEVGVETRNSGHSGEARTFTNAEQSATHSHTNAVFQLPSSRLVDF